jgi:hypothetical protein
MLNESGITVVSAYDNGVTIVNLLNPETDQVMASGSAKCHPNDYPDSVTGFTVAMIRALNSMADNLYIMLDFDFES